jgi:hypothetical protein
LNDSSAAVSVPNSTHDVPMSTFSGESRHKRYDNTSNSSTNDSSPRHLDQSHSSNSPRAAEKDDESMDEDTMLQMAMAMSISESDYTTEVHLSVEDVNKKKLDEDQNTQGVVTDFHSSPP